VAVLITADAVAGTAAPAAHADPKAISAQASISGRPSVAALQVALRARGLYAATVDGVRGPLTREGVRRFQARRGLAVDGIAGPRTRAALGWRGRPRLGSRAITAGARGWDVAALQCGPAIRGFPSGRFAGGLGRRGEAPRRRSRAWAGLDADGAAGPARRRGGGRVRDKR
jgi:peptidoglycan hydrolase-like protein with peptidoglycan-binding domain